MATRLILCARIARRRIEVLERLAYVTHPDGGDASERAYYVRGDKLRTGSLFTSRWTDEEAIARAMACAREHNPKARVRVSWCSICRKGSAPGIACAHEERANVGALPARA